MQLRKLNPLFLVWFIRILRIGFGIILITASIDKAIHPHDFAQMVTNYRVLGEDLSYWVAVFVPYLEMIVGLLLIFGFWLDAAVIINMSLMIVFLILVTQAYVRGLDISCGCYSVEEGHVINIYKLLTNLCYAVMSLILMFLVFRSSGEEEDVCNEGAG